jgi:hemerythrin-like metal-binding protein
MQGECAMQKQFISWTTKMSVGVAVLDEDHKELVSLLNKLHDGIAAGHGTETLGKILDGLVDYAKGHLVREEEMFAQTGYSDAAEHIKKHQEMAAKVLEIQARYNKGLFDALSLTTLEFMRNWLSDHIQGSDKSYKEHLNASGVH